MNIEDYKHRLVNDAQLCINDWQCSGDDDYLHKAAACLKAAVDNGKLEDVYGVYCNGCIGISKRENCNMLQKSLVSCCKKRNSSQKV